MGGKTVTNGEIFPQLPRAAHLEGRRRCEGGGDLSGGTGKNLLGRAGHARPELLKKTY